MGAFSLIVVINLLNRLVKCVLIDVSFAQAQFNQGMGFCSFATIANSLNSVLRSATLHSRRDEIHERLNGQKPSGKAGERIWLSTRVLSSNGTGYSSEVLSRAVAGNSKDYDDCSRNQRQAAEAICSQPI